VTPYNLDDFGDDSDAGTNVENEGGKKRKASGGKLPPNLPSQGDPPARFAAWITDLARLDDDPVVTGERWGVTGDEPIELVLRSGKRIGWAEQDQLFGARLQRPFVMVTGYKPRPLSPYEIQLAAWAIIQLATLRAQADERDEFRELWESYLAQRSLWPIDRNDEAAMRGALARWRQLADFKNDERPFVLVDIGSNERFVRRLDFAVHVRVMRRVAVGWQRLHGLARQCGWELDRIQYRATPGGAPYVGAKVFVVPAGWDEDDHA
jgi:hypothetical protein